MSKNQLFLAQPGYAPAVLFLHVKPVQMFHNSSWTVTAETTGSSLVFCQVVVRTKADYDGETKKGKLRSPKIAEFSISVIEGVSERLKVRVVLLLVPPHRPPAHEARVREQTSVSAAPVPAVPSFLLWSTPSIPLSLPSHQGDTVMHLTPPQSSRSFSRCHGDGLRMAVPLPPPSSVHAVCTDQNTQTCNTIYVRSCRYCD